MKLEGRETGRFVLTHGVCFSNAYLSGSQVEQFQQGTRDYQQSHYLLEGEGLENLLRKVAKLFAQVSHQVDVHEDMQGELQLMKDLEMSRFWESTPRQSQETSSHVVQVGRSPVPSGFRQCGRHQHDGRRHGQVSEDGWRKSVRCSATVHASARTRRCGKR